MDPRWFIRLPPAMSPAAPTTVDGYREHPQQAFDEHAGWGVARVVCQEQSSPTPRRCWPSRGRRSGR